ncbi:hypothetical protein [Flavobacterium cerinum]|uniref:Tetratricopeptide repeat protein n=1 Tax=Flavobacterium cerinum TaxID=2502784 RepID=A0ABY5IXT7_9FLAO|nr:hypothetical protein [Flavobacterium cerinum]UUC46159.1 hypothetical protein NOX80_02890 [Flavobacterium cerinum]
MNSVSGIINILSDAEKQEFIRFLKQQNKRHDTQNIQLFNLLKSDDINENNIDYKNKPALYALRKRLYDNLVTFITNKRFEDETSEEKVILKLIIAGKVFFKHKQYKPAFKILRKAEEKALKEEHFNLLNEIYHLQIEYAHLDEKMIFSELIEKYRENQKKFLQEEQLNLGYALLRKELSKIKEGAVFFDFQIVITSTIEQFNISLKEILTFKSLYQILFIANEYAALRNDYHQIERFVHKSYRFIQAKKELADQHLFYHIQILYFMGNTLFRNKKFEEAMLYLDKMESEMKKQDKVYYRQFYYRLKLLHCLIANYSGNAEFAITQTETILNDCKGAEISEVLDLQLSLAVFYFQQLKLDQLKQVFKNFAHTDTWYEKKQSMEWTIKKNLIEILLHVELKNIDYVMSRLNSFKRRYKKYLTTINEKRVLIFLSLVEKYLDTPENFASEAFQKQVEASFQWKSYREEDIFVMSFYAWLKAKIEKKNIYEITLKLVAET